MIPTGYRFLPTAEEVLCFYLRPAIDGQPLPCNAVVEAEIYGEKKEPWKIFDKNSEIPIWVLTKLKKKRRSKIDRIAGCGCWLNRSNKDILDSHGQLVGFDKYFTWKKDGRNSSGGNNGNWIMHEYSFKDESLSDLVICQIKNKDVEGVAARDKKRKTCVDNVDDINEGMSAMKKLCVVHEPDASTTSLTNQEHSNDDHGEHGSNAIMVQKTMVNCSPKGDRAEAPAQTESIGNSVPFYLNDNEGMGFEALMDGFGDSDETACQTEFISGSVPFYLNDNEGMGFEAFMDAFGDRDETPVQTEIISDSVPSYLNDNEWMGLEALVDTLGWNRKDFEMEGTCHSLQIPRGQPDQFSSLVS